MRLWPGGYMASYAKVMGIMEVGEDYERCEYFLETLKPGQKGFLP